MLFKLAKLTAWLAAAATLLSSPVALAADDKDNPSGQSTFISPDGDLEFAFTVPDNDNSDIYFALRVKNTRAWGAVGLGSDDMPGALYLMVYENEKGNVTFSPRLAYGNYEPQYFEDVKYEFLEGTGIFDDHMVVVAKCTDNCRNWPAGGTSKGYIDVSSPEQKAIYALGPTMIFREDAADAGLPIHERYGSFTIDMKRTQGTADAPVLTDDSKDEGTTFNSEKTGFYDVRAVVHAVFMCAAVAFVFPLGIGLKWGGMVRAHYLTQTAGSVFVAIGFAFGILASFHYQRSRGFHSLHQILGIIVIFAFCVQFSLGIIHHRKYLRYQMPTRFGTAHRILGQVAVALGFANALAGFSFALNRIYAAVLVGILIFFVFGLIALTWWRSYTARGVPRNRNSLNPQPYNQPPPFEPQSETQPPPWRQQQESQPSGLDDPPPGYKPRGEEDTPGIALHDVGPSPWRRGDGDRDEDDHALAGAAQRPREFT